MPQINGIAYVHLFQYLNTRLGDNCFNSEQISNFYCVIIAKCCCAIIEESFTIYVIIIPKVRDTPSNHAVMRERSIIPVPVHLRVWPLLAKYIMLH